ncbi:predicted protein, partial [Arabidopsis lyrata subsp. lyrata]
MAMIVRLILVYVLTLFPQFHLQKLVSGEFVQIFAGFMIFFSILGKFGAVFASIRAPINAALYCLFFAYIC